MKWISFKEKTPPFLENVLLFDPRYEEEDGGVFLGYYYELYGQLGCCPYPLPDIIHELECTHWMPLPRKPKKK